MTKTGIITLIVSFSLVVLAVTGPTLQPNTDALMKASVAVVALPFAVFLSRLIWSLGLSKVANKVPQGAPQKFFKLMFAPPAATK